MCTPCMQVYVYHVGSAKVVAVLSGHSVNVRDMAYDPTRNLLATCSFDKTVKVWGEAGAAAGATGEGAVR